MASALRTFVSRCPPQQPPSSPLYCFARSCRRPPHGRLTLPLRPVRCLASAAPRPGASSAAASQSNHVASNVPVTDAPPPSSSASTSSPPPSSIPFSPLPKPSLDWNSFFRLRLRRRRIQVAFSLTGFLVCGFGGAYVLSTGVAEPLVAQVPLDPVFTLGLLGAACAGMGWLAGPSIGNQVFYLLNWPFKSQMIRKESEFFTRIKRNRVDPSNSSAGNPVPDFYGERIQSVTGYRQWLKDQRAFNRKKTANFV
ncbi:hypothetical protein XA68_10038 [Ophiocordyceps unilateralis]|uniref:Presequence translocated-associated motor subunit PAM17 n=1 Tax=Ophiocordyceps unilateralis TaxID=268505 RepID=A0A2A9PWS1_OPHUN|nr:hypothetical protein XA68_10038 [Ophiocordyceps unilateralis]